MYIVNFTSFTPPPFSTEVSVPSLESAQSCICVLVVSILPLYAIFIFDFRIISSVLFCVFHFISVIGGLYIFFSETLWGSIIDTFSPTTILI